MVGQACDFFPVACGFVIGVIDGDAQLVFRDVEVFGQQLPSEGDRLFFEVIAERKVPQHFKERMVAGGIAHIVQIVVLTARAHRFLRCGGALVITRFNACEAILELNHARIGEHQGRVVARHQGRAVDHLVTVAGEKIEEGRADVVQRGHGGNRSYHKGARGWPPFSLKGQPCPL